jgi:hypothetical protein
MKQFQKYGLAAAVATASASALAVSGANTERSDQNLGDAAIVPYYTTTGGKVTGVHIINTTSATQVVKFRMRRGKDSRDAMDFNIIMSPKDEWVTSIQTNANPSAGKGGVKLITDDTTCTAPIFDADGTLAEMPETYAEGAEEGYIEIIGMGQAAASPSATAVAGGANGNPINAAAKHTKGVPADCQAVEYNFLRVTDAQAGTTPEKYVGVHSSELTNQVSSAGTTGLTTYTDTPDRALKVSWFIRDADGGLEVGGNAVHIEGFADAAMMTNQEQLEFNTAGLVKYDPFNFELPNLNQGSYPSASRTSNHDGSSTGNAETLFNRVRAVMGVDAVHNDWSDKTTDGSTVDTDWVVTLPGQYISEDPFCVIYAGYPVDGKACTASTALDLSETEIPLYLIDKTGASQFALYSREEDVLVDTAEQAPAGLDFSPSNSAEKAPDSVTMDREVNVLVFQRAGEESTGVLESAAGQAFTLPAAADDVDNGWMSLKITPSGTGAQFKVNGHGSTATTTDCSTSTTQQGCGVPVSTGTTRTYGAFEDASLDGDTVAIAMAVWKREFGDNPAAAYGRAVEHSYTLSSGFDEAGRYK